VCIRRVNGMFLLRVHHSSLISGSFLHFTGGQRSSILKRLHISHLTAFRLHTETGLLLVPQVSITQVHTWLCQCHWMRVHPIQTRLVKFIKFGLLNSY
jgi:hypothetical protein